MRRNIDEIMNGIKQKSEKGIAQKNVRRKAIVYTCLSLLLVCAICVGFVFNPFKGTVEEPLGVIENSSKEEKYPNYADKVDKSRYLSVKQLSANLMEGIAADGVTGKAIDDAFLSAYADLSMNLFKGLYAEGENALVSPLSAMYAFAMLANGAEGETAEQIEAFLGGMDTETLNEYLYFLAKYLEGDEVNIANSIWVTDSDRFHVNADFLQTNANYYSADLYKTAFNDKTVEDVNGWVKEKTKGMIEKIVEEYNGNEVMQLINAICFEAEWVGKADADRDGIFHNADGTEADADYMFFGYERKYIDTENAKGVIKDYEGGKYSFVALMPDEGISIDDYIASLDGKAFMAAVNSAVEGEMKLTMPKFKYNCSMDLIPALQALGMTDAFDPSSADLTGLGYSDSGNVFVSSATQDTFIEVSELGTRAAAVTSLIAEIESVFTGYRLTIDRPFVYAIIDTATGLPLFTGAVTGF